MTDTETAASAGEATVGNERHFVAHALAIESRGGRQHLTHARAAFRALVADDNDIAFLVALGADRGERVLLAIEAARRPTECQPLHAGHLDDGPVGSERAAQAHHAASGQNGIVPGAHNILIGVPLNLGKVVLKGPAGHGQGITVQVTMIEEGLEQERHTASFEQVLGDITARRFQICDVRCPFHDIGYGEQVEVDAAFMGDGRQMERRIG